MKKYLLVIVMLMICVLPISVHAAPDSTGVGTDSTGTPTECANKKDDDGDKLIDLNDPQCKSKNDLCEDGTLNCKTAGGTGANDALNIHINNPLSVSTIQDAIKKIMDVVLMLAIPVIIVLYIWAGFTYIMAQGNGEAIKKAHNRLLFTTLGAVIILGAWTIATAVVGTVNMITQ